jgi:FHA domain
MSKSTAPVPTTVVSGASVRPVDVDAERVDGGGYVLILDDGGTLALVADLLLGREPATHPDVTSGARRGLLIVDETSAVSRHHLAISTHRDGVDVTDLGSANGTMVVNGSTGTASPLVPKRATRLSIGDRVHLGSRSFQLGYRRDA